MSRLFNLASTAVLGFASLASLAHASLEVHCAQQHSVLYANTPDQAVLRILVKSDTEGASVKSFRFALKGDKAKWCAKSFKIFNSGTAPFFSPNAENAADKALAQPVKVKRQDKVITVTGDIKLKKGDNYLWLAIDSPANAPAGASFDVALRKMEASEAVSFKSDDPKGELSLYAHPHRIVPYFRAGWLNDKFPYRLKAEDFANMTDVILFHLKCDAQGNLKGGNDPALLKTLEQMKALRGENPVKIIVGVAHSKEGFAATAADAKLRRKFAQQLKFYIDKRGFDGVDIDWEYPKDAKEWRDFGYLLGEIRQQLGAHGKSISSAVLMYHNVPSRLVIDNLDFVNIMSYDRQGEHATMAQFQFDDKAARKLMPAAKIVLGLPFYSNDMTKPRDWKVQTGYFKIRELKPDLKPEDNTITIAEKPHYFNGPSLITQKCEFVKAQNLGGVMIWAYDADVAITDPASLRRAMYSSLKRSVRTPAKKK